jgi:hypothetical protein
MDSMSVDDGEVDGAQVADLSILEDGEVGSFADDEASEDSLDEFVEDDEASDSGASWTPPSSHSPVPAAEPRPSRRNVRARYVEFFSEAEESVA